MVSKICETFAVSRGKKLNLIFKEENLINKLLAVEINSPASSAQHGKLLNFVHELLLIFSSFSKRISKSFEYSQKIDKRKYLSTSFATSD